MPSNIDVTKPESGAATTASVRANFNAAKTEIETLQGQASAALANAAQALTDAAAAQSSANGALAMADQAQTTAGAAQTAADAAQTTAGAAQTAADAAQTTAGAAQTAADAAQATANAAMNATINALYPIGSIYISTLAANPATIFGIGVWVAFATGRALVGIDAAQAEFDTLEEIGGAKTHTLTANEMPTHTHVQDAHTHIQDAHTHIQDAHTHVQNAHTHIQDAHTHVQNAHGHLVAIGTTTPNFDYGNNSTATLSSVARTSTQDTNQVTAVNQNATATNQNATATNQNTTAANQNTTATNQNTTATNQSAGADAAHNNLQPYIVVSMWKRTA